MKKHNLEIAEEAILHLQDIHEYTESTWGVAQRKKYIQSIYEGFEKLRSRPTLGKFQPQIAPGMRSIRVEHHYIYYIVIDQTVRIVAVLHERMDPSRHINP